MLDFFPDKINIDEDNPSVSIIRTITLGADVSVLGPLWWFGPSPPHYIAPRAA